MTDATGIPPLPPRPSDAHKGTFGRVLVVAGSRGMSGAACLAGLGALRGGAGLVYVACPESIVATVSAVEPSYLTIPLPEDSAGRCFAEAQSALLERIGSVDVMAVGPGLGQSPELVSLLCHWYRELRIPLVVDADGLNALSSRPDSLADHAGPRVLTPHPGEFARLTGAAVADISSRRTELAREFAAAHGVILVLKGAGTVVTDGRELFVNATGNSGMATGGSGDVLTGVIAALIAQGMVPQDAARLGAHVHGLAGDLAAAELSEIGMIASDLPRYLPAAWRQLEARDAPTRS